MLRDIIDRIRNWRGIMASGDNIIDRMPFVHTVQPDMSLSLNHWCNLYHVSTRVPKHPMIKDFANDR